MVFPSELRVRVNPPNLRRLASRAREKKQTFVTAIAHTGLIKPCNNQKYLVYSFVINITYHCYTYERNSVRRKMRFGVSLAGELRYFARR